MVPSEHGETMPRPRVSVTISAPDPDLLPQQFSEGLALLLDLLRNDRVEAVASRLRIHRQGGYVGVDVFLLFLSYFASGSRKGIRTFWPLLGAVSHQLGALAGRMRLPSPASVSRALAAVQEGTLRALFPWLLTEVVDAEPLLRHRAVQSQDAMGAFWHVFDFDPTVTTLRHRALPSDEDMPTARRRSAQMAAPGYPGRKRGDVQFRRATLQHHGSGLWLSARLSPGNGEARAELREAADTVVALCGRLNHPPARALVRADGEFGGVPSLTTMRDRGLAFITRLTRPDLFDQEDVRQRIRDATWTRVPDSMSGPVRSATELGVVTLTPGVGVLREDGSTFAPIDVRVVVTRYARAREAQRGVVIDGWQYELFAADVSPQAWPAAEAVAAYFGRAAQENRFAQEDRELGLDRIFSYHLPGQELATVFGLMVWNLRITLGFALDKPPDECQPQPLRCPELDLRPVPIPEPIPVALPELAAPPSVAPPLTQAQEARGAIVAELDGLDWEKLLKRRPGWSYLPGRGELECPDGQILRPRYAEVGATQEGRSRSRIFFTARPGACDGCERRSDCFSSQRIRTAKMVNFSIEPEVVIRLRELLCSLPSRDKNPPPIATVPGEPQRGSMPKRGGLCLRPPDHESMEGPWAIAPPTFLQTVARDTFRDATAAIWPTISVHLPDRTPGQHPQLVSDAATRQRRRLTWTQRTERYALPRDAVVSVGLAGGARLAPLFRSFG